MRNIGHFIISLDLELQWGVRHRDDLDTYSQNIENTDKAISKLLGTFNEFNVSATFATVGFLFANNQRHLASYIPDVLPNYKNISMSPYEGYLDGKLDQTLHFRPDIIRRISDTGQHEVASHTLSHFFCLETGPNLEDFERDTISSISIAMDQGYHLKSFVYPRNQIDPESLTILQKHGFTSYRGPEKSWMYRPTGKHEPFYKRLARLLDSYFPISGNNIYSLESLNNELPYNLPSSRFLRPYNPKLAKLESLRLQRITNSMTKAAKNGKVFHLWWHPHNFGSNMDQNILMLKKILQHYCKLREKYEFENLTMSEVSNKIILGKL